MARCWRCADGSSRRRRMRSQRCCSAKCCSARRTMRRRRGRSSGRASTRRSSIRWNTTSGKHTGAAEIRAAGSITSRVLSRCVATSSRRARSTRRQRSCCRRNRRKGSSRSSGSSGSASSRTAASSVAEEGGMFRRTVEAMEGYVPGEQPRDRRYIKLNTNENPYPPSPQVLEALRDAVGENLRLYPRPLADELRERAARLFRLLPQNVLIGNGSDELLAILMRAVVDPGDAVAYPVPTYSLYDTLVALHSGEAIHVPFPADFSFPAALADVDARLVIVCNPN